MWITRKICVALSILALLVGYCGVAEAGPYDDAVLADNPLAYYRFEEPSGPTATDASPNGNDGTYQGGVTYGNPGASVELGNAAGFANGSPDSSVAVPVLGTGLAEYSIEAWVNPNSFTTWDTLYNVDGWSGGWFHGQFLNNGAFQFSLAGGGPNDRQFGAGSFPLNNWTHLVGTYDSATGNVTVYANGTSLGTQNFGGSPAVNLNAGHIGAWNGNSREFGGLIDEVAFYDSVLSQDQLRAHYVAAIPLPEMLSYWNFDSKSGTTIPDQIAGSTHHGTLMGGADITTGGQGYGGGEAMALGANGDYLDVADPTTYDFNSSFTWHAMVKTDDNSGAIFSRNPDGTAWNQGSKALFVRNRGGQGEVEWDSGWVANPRTFEAVDDDEWHQIIATFEESTDLLRIYVDGQLEFDGTHDVNRFDEHTNNHNGGLAETSFTVGMADFSGGLASLDTLIGLMDDAALFDLALTDHALNVLIQQGPSAFLPTAAVVPEPSTLALALLGLLGLALFGWRRRTG